MADLLEREVEHVLPARRAPDEAHVAAGVAGQRRLEVAAGELAHQHLEDVERLDRGRRVVHRRRQGADRGVDHDPHRERRVLLDRPLVGHADERDRSCVGLDAGRRGRAGARRAGATNSPTAGTSSITAPARAPRPRARARSNDVTTPGRAAARRAAGRRAPTSGRADRRRRSRAGYVSRAARMPFADDRPVERARPQAVGHALQQREEEHARADQQRERDGHRDVGRESGRLALDAAAARRARTRTRRGRRRSRA